MHWEEGLISGKRLYINHRVMKLIVLISLVNDSDESLFPAIIYYHFLPKKKLFTVIHQKVYNHRQTTAHQFESASDAVHWPRMLPRHVDTDGVVVLLRRLMHLWVVAVDLPLGVLNQRPVVAYAILCRRTTRNDRTITSGHFSQHFPNYHDLLIFKQSQSLLITIQGILLDKDNHAISHLNFCFIWL